MKARRAGLALLLSACGGDAGNEAADDPGTASVALQSEDVIAGRRPALNLTCGVGAGSFWIELVRTPDPPPPERGTFGSVKVDDGAPVRLELAWLGADRWAPRLDHDREAALVRAMLAGRSVYFAGPEGTTDRAYRWDMSRLGGGVEELRRRCG